MNESRYATTHVAATSVTPMSVCVRCGSLIDGDRTLSHDDFHLRVETALSAAQGYNLDGTPIR